jgi:hypothetical protein
MIVVKMSPYSGKMHEMEIDITKQQLIDFYEDKLGLIQDAFPHLNRDEREFIISGIPPHEWDEIFKEIEE